MVNINNLAASSSFNFRFKKNDLRFLLMKIVKAMKLKRFLLKLKLDGKYKVEQKLDFHSANLHFQTF